MITILMMAVASGIALLAYSGQRGMTPDVERMAGRLWADMAGDEFAQCPRQNGFRFWMGCTDKAVAPKAKPSEEVRR